MRFDWRLKCDSIIHRHSSRPFISIGICRGAAGGQWWHEAVRGCSSPRVRRFVVFPFFKKCFYSYFIFCLLSCEYLTSIVS